MNLMKLYIKHMAGLRSNEHVKEELERLGIPFELIYSGGVDLLNDVTLKQREHLKINLLPFGMKLHEAKKGILIEKIKKTILEMLEYSDGLPVGMYSVHLSVKLSHNYTYLANIFSEVNGISIQQFIILCKIEKVKELLLSGEISLSDISYRLHYSSVAHLSGQFKKVTGLSPSGYKVLVQKKDEIQESKLIIL